MAPCPTPSDIPAELLDDRHDLPVLGFFDGTVGPETASAAVVVPRAAQGGLDPQTELLALVQGSWEARPGAPKSQPWDHLEPAVVGTRTVPEDLREISDHNPAHYQLRPAGIELEAIEYLRGLLHCQATAGKYVYRLGAKDAEGWEKDLGKAAWYLEDVLEHSPSPYPAVPRRLLRTVHPEASTRARIFLAIISGRISDALEIVQAVLDGDELLDPTV